MNIRNQQQNNGVMSNLSGASGKRWYVMRVKAGKECMVKEYIEALLGRNADLSEYVSQVLVPMEEVCIVRGGKKRVKNSPLYSGYVFVEALMNGATISALRDVPNVFNFLGYGKDDNKPKPMTRQEVEGLLGAVVEMRDAAVKSADVFNAGESVKVKDGPFCGFNAVVECVDDKRQVLNVVVKIFGRNTPIELGFSKVEKQ